MFLDWREFFRRPDYFAGFRQDNFSGAMLCPHHRIRIASALPVMTGNITSVRTKPFASMKTCARHARLEHFAV